MLHVLRVAVGGQDGGRDPLGAERTGGEPGDHRGIDAAREADDPALNPSLRYLLLDPGCDLIRQAHRWFLPAAAAGARAAPSGRTTSPATSIMRLSAGCVKRMRRASCVIRHASSVMRDACCVFRVSSFSPLPWWER